MRIIRRPERSTTLKVWKRPFFLPSNSTMHPCNKRQIHWTKCRESSLFFL